MTVRFPFYSSLRAKASALFLAVFLVIILPVNQVIYFKVKSTLEEADTKELQAEAGKLASRVRLDPPVIPLPVLGYTLKLQLQRDLYFEDIFTSPDFPTVPNESFLLDTFDYDTFKIVNLRNQSVQAPSLIVSLSRSNSRLLNQVYDLKGYLFVANAASILLAVGLVFLATGIMLRPMEKIMSVADRINASNSIERVPVPKTRDESQKLAETLNDMLSRIEASIKNQINFFASATHELKTPLAVMQAELSLALLRVTDSETRKILESQLNEVQRLDQIIHDFLLISQLKSDTLTLRRKEERLEEVIFAAMKKVKYLSQEHASTIKVLLDDKIESSRVLIDFDKMETVFSNLMENAILYSPRGAVIEVFIKGQEVLISNPVNSPTRDIHLLTAEFKRSEEFSNGLGMGLWLSDKIIQLHGANLLLSEANNMFIAKMIFQRV